MLTQKDQIQIKLMKFSIGLTSLTDGEAATVADHINENMSHEQAADTIHKIVGRRVQVLTKNGVHKRIKVENTDPGWDNMAGSGNYNVIYEA